MRIGLLTGEFPPLQGGIGMHCHVLSQVLVQQGHEAFIFSDVRAQQQDDAIPVTHLRGKWRYNSIQQIKHWLAQNQLDVVNLHYQTAAFNMSPWVHAMPHFIKVPFVTTFHDLRFPYLFPKAGSLRDWVVMHLANSSDGVISTNYEDFARLQHLNFAKVIPIGSSIPTQLPPDYDRSKWRAKVGATEDDLLLGFFGFINHSKGYDTLIKALKKLHERGISAKIMQIGGRTGTADPTNATYADTLDTLINNLSVGDSIHSTGFVQTQDVSAYLLTADLMVLPFRDGASFRRSSLMAAIAHHCPIVTTTPGIEIPVFTQKNMAMVPPDDAEQLADTIENLHNNHTQRDQLCDGVAELHEFFDWERIASENAAFFQQVVESRR